MKPSQMKTWYTLDLFGPWILQIPYATVFFRIVKFPGVKGIHNSNVFFHQFPKLEYLSALFVLANILCSWDLETLRILPKTLPKKASVPHN